jgi:hypothetical protein
MDLVIIGLVVALVLGFDYAALRWGAETRDGFREL